MRGTPSRCLVPGEPIALAGDADGAAARLVHAAARLADAGLGPHALVGGLAVMAQLGAAHRATHDIDLVTETTEPSTVARIAATIGTADPANSARAIVDEVHIDVIETQALTAEGLDGIEGSDLLFVVAHRWALESATPRTLVAAGSTAVVGLATPAALVGAKTAALAAGRRRQPHKRGSDLYDIYRLCATHDRTGALSAALDAAPFALGRLVADGIRSLVLDEPERAALWLDEGSEEMATVSATDLHDVLEPLVQRLAP